MRSPMSSTAAIKTTSMGTTSKARPPVGGKASDVSAVIKPTERPGACSWLKMRSRRPVEPRTSAVRSSSVERVAMVEVAVVEVVAIDDRPAVGDVGVVVVDHPMAMPVRSPMMPAPPISPVEADSEADCVRWVQPAIPDSGILVPSRPRLYAISINQPWIIFRDVDDVGAGRLDDDGRVLGRYGLLLRILKIARFLRALAPHLYGIHHVLFLVVVSVAERRRPGEVFVHVAQDGWECSERLDARVPRLLVHSLSQGLALQIRMRVHPLVCVDVSRA